MIQTKKHIVVVGGGTGTHGLLKGLKRYADELTITAIVTMADSGGSTGRLRDEFGHLPVGDVRSALAALAADVDEHHELLREIFLYRFAKGEGLVGHNFGNLLLTALTDILGTEEAAITAASRLLRVRGTVVPVTTDNVHLVATYEDGAVVVGEHDIDEPLKDRNDSRIVQLAVTPHASISNAAATALATADMVVLGPGDLYTSILANCVIDGFTSAIVATTPVVYICNLMSKVGQTKGMHASEHIAEISRYIGRVPDHVILNTAPLPHDLVKKYRQDDEHPVEVSTIDAACTVHVGDFLATDEVITKAGDVVRRSLIRHDGEKLTQRLRTILDM
jgi:uncharacterized cofD-like protein